jgi:valyl-tRNA synthetase
VVALARLESLAVRDGLPEAAGHARTLTPAGIEASVALDRVVDVARERTRLEDRLVAVAEDIERAERKLADGDFTSRAPPEVVDRARAKLAEGRATRAKLEGQLAALGEA